MIRKLFLMMLGMGLLALSLSATIMVPLTLPELTAKSDKVVVGTVQEMRTRWTTNQWGDELIVTDVAVAVEETLKGVGSNAITATIEGGRVGEVELVSTHMPTFKVGEKVVLFLVGNDNELTVYSGLQGKLSVAEDGSIRGKNVSLDDVKLRVKQLTEK